MSGPGDVPPGPFEDEPFELGRRLTEDFADDVGGDEVVRRCTAWLGSALDEAGEEQGGFDCEIVALQAAEGWTVAQVVAGWVRRAAGA